jgi:predicted DNA-binding transcriptional regulator AlpA
MTPKRSSAPSEGTDVILTPAEVAIWLHIKPRQLERFGVPAVKLGHKTVRYVKADVLAWLASQKTQRAG